jgi:ABC-type transporter Mla subunit MlaD
MSTPINNGASRDSTRFVALFQKAHAHIATLRKVDEQIAALFEQRRKSLDDLRAVQSQINNEFDRVLELERVIPADMLSASKASPKEAYDPRQESPPALEPRLTRLESTMS